MWMCVVSIYAVWMCCFIFFFKQKTAYEMRISDWSSDVCSSDLSRRRRIPSPSTTWSSCGAATAAMQGRLRALRSMLSGSPGSPGSASTDRTDRKSVVEGKRVSVRVDLGGRRIIKKKKRDTHVPKIRQITTIMIETNQ